MATDVQIVNLALQELGCERITLLADNNKRAKLMTDLYDIVRDHVLSSFPWSFATEEVTLETPADDSGGSSFKYAYEYNLPANHVRVRGEYSDLEYKVLGKKIQTDEKTIELTITVNDILEADFPTDFVMVFYMSLALYGCHSLTQDKALKAQIKADLKELLENTRFNESRESTVDEFEIDSFLDVRL